MIWPPPKVRKEDTLAIGTSSLVPQRHFIFFLLLSPDPIPRPFPGRKHSETEAYVSYDGPALTFDFPKAKIG
jgi:hypothetical protein